MKRSLALVLVALGLAGVSSAETFEFKMISSGSNRPGVPMGAAPYRDILVALHARPTPSQLLESVGIAEDSLERSIARLRAEGLVRDTGGTTVPTCMVVTVEEGERLVALADEVARRTLPALRAELARREEVLRSIAGFRNLPEAEVRFFFASDVLLDNWQISGVERDWFAAERPRRGNSRYYAALMERADGEVEAFGIYGNQIVSVGKERLLGVYGNRRGSARDLSRMSTERLRAMAGLPDSSSRTDAMGHVLDAIVRAHRSEGAEPLPETIARGLEEIGLAEQGQPRVAVLDTADFRRLSELAAAWRPSLLRQLRGTDSKLRQEWERSRWGEEISYDEFRIWWYHLFYSALTDRLAAAGQIRVPESGLFHYIVAR